MQNGDPRPALRRWLWLLLLVVVPVPYFTGETGFTTIAILLTLALRLVAAVLLDGGPVTRLIGALVVAQAMVYLVASNVLARLLARGLHRLGPAQRRRSERLAATVALAGVAASVAAGLGGGWVAIGALTQVAGAVLREPPRVTSDAREPCAQRTELRRPFFGDLHVHTTLSFDAAAQDTRTRPRDTYRFARGEPLALPPYDRDGRPARSARLARPLDFAAATDHAEFFGEMNVCRSAGSPGSGSPICRLLRTWPRVAFMLLGGDYISGRNAPSRYGLCGSGGEVCRDGASAAWRETQEAADEAYDRSAACRFTTFVGYEWTRSPSGRNLHRNVLFRSAVVPPVPISSVEAHTPEELWGQLRAGCTQAGTGCDAITIPHNSNLSGGLMFLETDSSGAPLSPERAAERASFELLAEIMQHKGASECLRGAGSSDEECDFEQLPYDSFAAQVRPELARDKVAGSYLRDTLGRGLALEQSLGTNPFKLGFVGSTDTHFSAAGLVDEAAFPGHGGGAAGEGERAGAGPAELPPFLPDEVEFNPGGLAVLWAEENSREALWAALRRRETYATSGPRIVVRFFGGFDYDQALCESPEVDRAGYARGVPMGGDLPAPPASDAVPRFVVSVLRDPGTEADPGTPLERVQIVKGWLENGVPRERVHDVAGAQPSGTGIDLATCTPDGRGFDASCTVWSDPDFDPGEPSFYYARVLESPTCRWQVRACNARAVDCTRAVPAGLAACCDPSIPKTIQERAWTSPIWYRPVRAA